MKRNVITAEDLYRTWLTMGGGLVSLSRRAPSYQIRTAFGTRMSLTRQFSANYGSIATLAFNTTLLGTILCDDPRYPSITTAARATLVLLHVAESAPLFRAYSTSRLQHRLPSPMA
jgi:hypothetical protein